MDPPNNSEKIDQLLAEIEEFYRKDREAIARAKVERENWLKEKKNEKQGTVKNQ